MATQTNIEDHYDTVGPLHALRMKSVQGDYPDYTCAFFDGDYSKSYVQAQYDKHAWVFENLRLGSDLQGKRVLDIGCGWGPILNAVRERGGHATGLTLSPGQIDYCQEHGLDARLRDYKELGKNELTGFDGIVSIGAFEHFCSVEEMLAGKQEEVYRRFFEICAARLPKGGRLYLQTMTWGLQVPDYSKLSLDADPDSTEAILARMAYMYPGSWLPNGLQQLIACADQYFNFVDSSNGRLDYLETLRRWSQATQNLWKPSVLPQTLRYGVPLIYRAMTNRATRIQLESIRRADQSTAFAREIMSHERAFFAKK